MRITVATGIYPPEIGGPATYLSRFVPKMRKRGWKVKVVTYGDKRSNVVAVKRNWHRFFSFFKEVYRSARNSDVIFCTDTISAGLPASIAAWFLGKPFVIRFVGDAVWETARTNGWTEDSFDVFQNKSYGPKISFLRFVQRRVLKSAEVITVSKFLVSVLKRWGVSRTHLVPNAVVDFKLPSRAELREKMGLKGKFVVLSVGRLTKYKRIDQVIKACSKSNIPDLLLVIVGDGPELANLKKLAANEKVEVFFAGRKNARQVRSFMKAADIFVLNSEYEGMSHALLEAMSVKCPVLASNVGGNVELVRGKGLLFGYADEKSLRNGLVKYYNYPSLRKRLASAAFEKLPEEEEVASANLNLLEKWGVRK